MKRVLTSINFRAKVPYASDSVEAFSTIFRVDLDNFKIKFSTIIYKKYR